jgi:hypothetical protein
MRCQEHSAAGRPGGGATLPGMAHGMRLEHGWLACTGCSRDVGSVYQHLSLEYMHLRFCVILR